MSEDLQKQLADMLSSLLATASDGAQWAKGEIPLLVAEKILLGRVESTVMLAGSIALAIVLLWLAVTSYARASNHKGSSYDIWPERPGGFLFIVASIGLCVCSFSLIASGRYAAMVWFAPRLYIVEWLRRSLT